MGQQVSSQEEEVVTDTQKTEQKVPIEFVHLCCEACSTIRTFENTIELYRHIERSPRCRSYYMENCAIKLDDGIKYEPISEYEKYEPSPYAPMSHIIWNVLLTDKVTAANDLTRDVLLENGIGHIATRL